MLDVERRSSNDVSVTEESTFEKGGEKRKEWLEGERKEIGKELAGAQKAARAVEAQLKKINQNELDESGRQALSRLETQFGEASKAAEMLVSELAEANKEWLELQRKEIFADAIRKVKGSQEIPDAWKLNIIERLGKSDEANSADYFLTARVGGNMGEARVQMLEKNEAEFGPLDKAEAEIDPLFLIAAPELKQKLEKINEREREFQLVAHGKLPLQLEQQFKEEVSGLASPSNEEIAAIRKKYTPDLKSLEENLQTDWRLLKERLVGMTEDPRFKNGLRAVESISDTTYKQLESARMEIE